MSMPHRVIWPELGGKSPESRLVRVDLPAPLGPITAWIRSRQRLSETPSTAASPPKRLVNCWAESSTSNNAPAPVLTQSSGQTKQATRRKQYHQHNKDADPKLPMFTQIDSADLRQILEHLQHIFKGECAHDGTGKVAHAAQNHHQNSVRADVKTHQLGVD